MVFELSEDETPYRVAEERLPAEANAMVGNDDTDIEGVKNLNGLRINILDSDEMIFPVHSIGT